VVISPAKIHSTFKAPPLSGRAYCVSTGLLNCARFVAQAPALSNVSLALIDRRMLKADVYSAHDRSVHAYLDRRTREDADKGWNLLLITSYPVGWRQSGKDRPL
jgi:hypothetical protein